jgi:predicted TIM-barrel fold metal-dependent hydrolase
MLSQHPALEFVGLHMASLEWSVDALAAFLDHFPNAHVDLAARIGQLQFQSNQDLEKVRNFLIKYQNRVMYGTDLELERDPQSGQACDAACRQEVPFPMQARLVWLRDWQYFTSSALISVPELDNPVRGLALPKSVVDKIYYQNAQHEFPTSWQVGNRKNASS